MVYLVFDHETREPLAAKTFLTKNSSSDVKRAERFEIESRAWIGLDIHPNIVQARFFQIVEGRPLLFLEHIGGGTLHDWIGTPRLMDDLPQALRFGIQVCDGMLHAHSQGIRAHRDLKPRNCLIAIDGTLKVSDFGLASVVGEGNRRGRVGTAEYMSPEQWEREEADLRSDIYSFGAMFYTMLTGSPPFGKRPQVSEGELRRRHAEDRPITSSGELSATSALVDRCMAKRREDRFGNFGEVRGKLAQIYEEMTQQPAPSAACAATMTAQQWNNRAASLSQLGRQEEAITCCDRALGADPGYTLAWVNKGVANDLMNRREEAIQCYDRALSSDPNCSPAWTNKGVALTRLGKASESLHCFDRAIESKSPDAWAGKGSALARLGRAMEALPCYDRALEMNPSADQVWTSKGNAMADLGRHVEAIGCYARALELNGRCAEAWFNKGAVLLNQFHRVEQAKKCFERAKRLGLKEGEIALAVCKKQGARSKR